VQAAAEIMKQLGIYDRYGSDLHAPEQVDIIFSGGSFP
jgi:hypothetical protein